MMKLFVKHLLIFLIPVLLANFLFIPWVRNNTGAEAYLDKVVHITSEIDTLILADSHGTVLDNHILEKQNIANLSYGSDSYADMFEKLRYVSERQHIERVIITADRHTLSRHRETSNNSYLSALLDSYGSIGYGILQVLPLFDSRNVAIFQEYLLSKFGDQIDRIAGKESGESLPWQEDPQRALRAKKRVKYHFPSEHISANLKNILFEIITYCQAEKIELIGLMYPLSREYYEALQGRDMGAAKLLEEAGIPILKNDLIYLDTPELFKDQDHLNALGGTEFTKILVEGISSNGPVLKDEDVNYLINQRRLH